VVETHSRYGHATANCSTNNISPTKPRSRGRESHPHAHQHSTPCTPLVSTLRIISGCPTLIAMALLDKVPGELELYIGGYVRRAVVSKWRILSYRECWTSH
jgi:hypothetical protein